MLKLKFQTIREFFDSSHAKISKPQCRTCLGRSEHMASLFYSRLIKATVTFDASNKSIEVMFQAACPGWPLSFNFLIFAAVSFIMKLALGKR